MESVEETSSEGGPTDSEMQLSDVLTAEEFSMIPDSVRLKLEGWSTQVGNMTSMKDSQISALNFTVSELQTSIQTSHNEILETRKNLDETGGKYRSAVASLAQVEESVIGYHKQVADAQLKADAALREKDEMVIVVQKRNEEIDRLSNTVTSLSDQLQSANVAKIEALVKVDELTGKEMELEYKEKQVEREKEWVSKQVQLLSDELDKKNAEIITNQREFSIKLLQLQTDLSEKNEQIRIAELSLSNVQKANEAQEKHIEHLINKLKDAEDMEIKIQENFRQEVTSQRKIADLYKESGEDASKKVEELEDAVSNLQDLLKNATVKYGELETKFMNTAKSLQDEIAKRDDEIPKIKKELENANKLIENFQSKGLTDEMIQSLSPAAAAATSMLKNSKSLTQIYSEYHDLCNEVIIRKQETTKLNQMVKELLQEIKTQGPELEREKIKNQKNLEKLEVLQSQLDLALRESDKAKTDASQATKSQRATERENVRLRAQLNDLAMQVRALLMETEVQRGNYNAPAVRASATSGVAEVPDMDSSAQQIVSERLVTFKNIEDLQLKNQNLLGLVRELSATQEKATREAHENQLQLIKDSFQEAMRELEVLREKRMAQDTLLESVVQQRDTLAELLKQQKTPVKVADSGSATKLTEIQRLYESLQAHSKSLQEEFDTYKKERGEHEKLAIEQSEKLRDDVMKMRTDNAKLASQVEYNNERTKIYNANLETYKKNIVLLEERNKKYSATTLKLEQNVELLKSELSAAQQKLARTEVALNSMTQERNALRDTNTRLQAERDLLKRDQNTQQILRLNLQEIKNGLELSNSAFKQRLENEIETLQKDNAILRRKVSTETERFKEAVFSWEAANKELIERLRKDQDSLQATKEELENSKSTIARLTADISDLESQVKVLSNATLETVNAAEDQPVTIPGLERQIKELQTQLRDAKIENETMGQHLAISRQSAEEYRTLCGSIEGQISVVSETSKQLTEELQARLEGKDEVIRDIQIRLSTAERETAVLKDEKEIISRELENKTVTLEEEIGRMRRDLQAANAKLQSAFEENVKVKLDLEKQSLVYKDIQEKYNKELESREADANTLNDIKTELETVRLKVVEEEQARRNAENLLNQAVTDWTNKGNAMKQDLERLQESKDELATLNTSLQDQIINMTTRMEAQSAQGQETSEGSAEMDSQKTSEQWLHLIRYLRREKEIAKTKTEMAESTCSRYESQIKHLEKQIEDLKRELSELQDRSHVSIITSAKQADLLRKVETLSALTDSNRMLREEKETAMRELQELTEKFTAVEVEIGPLREKSSELEARCEALLNENTALKQDVGRWRTRASALLEKTNKVNPEELKRLQSENDNLSKQVQSFQEANKKQQMDIARHLQQVKNLQQQTVALQTSNQTLQNERKTLTDDQKKVGDEREKLRGELQTLRLEISSLKNAQVEKDQTVDRVNKELENVNKQLEEQKNTVKAVKSIARKYKKSYEELQTEHETLQAEKTSLETAAAQGGSAGEGAASGTLTDTQREELGRYEAQIKELREEVETLKRDAETLKNDRSQAEERMRNHMKTLRDKLAAANGQKAETENQLKECRAKNTSLEVSADENSVRFAALKSQYEGRLGRLEKENKDLKAAATGTVKIGNPVPEVSLNLQQENEEQKKELDMLRQRIAVLENRFKLNQTTKVVSPEKVLPVEKAKANIRPIAGPSPKQTNVARPPLTASIKPISMPRKATVSVSAMPTQNPQASSSNIQSVSAVVAPVSQAQVSTSTPDQSSSAPESSPQQQMHQIPVNPGSVPISSAVRQAAAVQPTVTVAPVAVGAGVAASNSAAGSVPSISITGVGAGQPQQGTSGGGGVGGNETQASHQQDPPTSSATQMMEESEMGDSSEQVSSSEGSTHQNILTVAPLRSKQHEVQQSSSSTLSHQPQPGPSKNQDNSGTEEPSPSSSTLPPTQSSNKRGRGNEDLHHSRHHDEEEDLLNEPDTKRTRIMIDREAEALGQQESSNDQMIEEEEEDEEDEREADQGPSAVDDAQVQHSDTTTKGSAGRPVRHTNDDRDSDSDVIIIDTDDDDVLAPKATTSRASKIPVEEEEEVEDVEEEEEVVEEEEQEDEEDIMDDDEEVDDDDDEHGEDDGHGGKKIDVDYDDVEGQEGREAESLEQDDDDDIREVHDNQEDSQDILDSNDSNLNPSDFSSHHDQGNQHELREAEQSIDDEVEEERDMVPEQNIQAVGGSSFGGSLLRPPPRENVRPQNVTPLRPGQAGRGVPPMLGRQQHMLTPSFSSGQYPEDADDSIVPSTPTLYVPRRSDGFAEAVSSPQIQPGGRFTFASVSGTDVNSGSSHAGTGATSSANSGLDDTRIDFLGYEDGGSGTTGRSVPSTPLQVSPPVEGVELSAEMQADEDAAQEEGISAAAVVDVQPTSSSFASTSGSDVPAITVTSAMDSSSGVPFQPLMESASKGVIESTRLIAVGTQPRTSTHTEVSSVTSSDEDKVVIAGTSSAAHMGTIQHPSTSTSSRAASPTPSSNTSSLPTEQKEPLQQPQQQQQQQQSGRTRPTPIVWDQPSSSSSFSNPVPRPARGGMMGNRGAVPVRHTIQPDQGHLPPLMMRGFRPMMMLRGQNQSARRSRPHQRGAPGGAGPGAGSGGPGNIGGRMPFQKPY